MSKKKAAETRAARAQALIETRRKAERRRRLIAFAGVAAVVVVVAIGAWFLATRDSTGDQPAATPTAPQIDGYSVVLGEEDAPHTVAIYEDLQCPACAQLEATVGDQLSQGVDDGTVKVEYRLISFLDNMSTNDYSSRAMNAALVVLDETGPEAFRAFHDELYAQQPSEGGAGYSDDELIDLAVDAGADADAIRPGIEDKAFDQWIQNATDQSSKDGVTGTPTVEVDGERADNPVQGILEVLNQ
jgi:protein-disulfide isomerase